MSRRRRSPARLLPGLRMTRLGAVICALTLLAGLGTVGAGVAHYRFLDARVDHLVAAGEPIIGTVVAAGSYRGRGPSYAEVRYVWRGEQHQRRLHKFSLERRLEPDAHPVLYVDPAAPERLATADGYLSEPRWAVRTWGFLTAVGLLLLGLAGWMLWTARQETRPPRADAVATRGDLLVRLRAPDGGAPEWDLPFQRLEREMRRLRRRRRASPVQLVATFQPPEPGHRPAFGTGPKVEAYSPGDAQVTVTIPLPARPTDGDSYRYLVRALRDAADAGRRQVARTSPGTDLSGLRALIGQLPAAGTD